MTLSLLAFQHAPVVVQRRSETRFAVCRRNHALESGADPTSAESVASDARSRLADFERLVKDYVEDPSTPDSALASALSPDCAWDSPLLNEKGPDAIVGTLSRFRDFFEFPAIQFAPLDESSCEWTVSGTWPLPWRPRVCVSGQTRLSFAATSPPVATELNDSWDVQPLSVFLTVLPQWEDIYWLYVSPHAESLNTQTRVERRAADYNIVSEAPRNEIVLPVQEKELASEALLKAPPLPGDFFVGALRRQESWTAIRPIFLVFDQDEATEEGRVPAQVRVPIPTRFRGLPPTDLPEYARVVSVPRRKYAVKRITREVGQEEYQQIVSSFTQQLINDGLEIDGLPRFAHYDCKIGFNSVGKPAIAGYFRTPLQARRSEVSIPLRG